MDPQITHGCKALWKGGFCVSISWAGHHTQGPLLSIPEHIISPSPHDCPAWALNGVSRQSLCKAGLAIRFFQGDHPQAWPWSLMHIAAKSRVGSGCGFCRRAVPGPLVVRVSQPLTTIPRRAQEQEKRSLVQPRFIPGLERSWRRWKSRGLCLSPPPEEGPDQ